VAKRTAMYELHKQLGARFTEFGGWEMPVRYTTIKEEHMAVRQKAGVFDLSHMGEIRVKGKDAVAFLGYVLPSRVKSVKVGKAVYTPMLHENAGIVDDLIFYRIADDEYLLIVNASNVEKDFAHLARYASEKEVEIIDESAQWSLVAIQGPEAENIVAKVAEDVNVRDIPFFGFAFGKIDGMPVSIARTGYTGEDGFEILVQWDNGPRLMEVLLEAGKDEGVLPCGLGARDSLRLEAGFPLYGEDMDDNTTPVEANLMRFIRMKKKSFVGKEALEKKIEEDPKLRRTGIVMLDRAIPRHGSKIYKEGEEIGYVSSGTFGPAVGAGIAQVYIPYTLEEGTEIMVEIRGKLHPAKVVGLPIYRKDS